MRLSLSHLASLFFDRLFSSPHYFGKMCSYQDQIAKKLERQAKKIGSRVTYCDPQHTSTACNKCGHKHSDNRLDQTRFHCNSCGYQENADIIAAKNILDKASGSGDYSLDVA